MHEIRVFMSFDRDRDRDLHERLIRHSHGSDSPFEVALVWGRRELTCTKPLSAKPDDSMYTWFWSVPELQIGSEMRKGTRLGGTA